MGGARKKEGTRIGRVVRGVPSRGRGWRRRTLPQGLPCSTIRAARLNGRVRDGNGCGPRAMTTSQFVVVRVGRMRGRCLGGLGLRVRRPRRRSGRGDQDLNRVVLLVVAMGCEHTASFPSPDSRGSSGGGTDCGQASRGISTAQLHVSPRFHLPPINVLVSYDPSECLRTGNAHLGGGFPLRCFQRLSLPNVATRPCHWRDNRYTSGWSIPVLSY